MIKSLVIMNNQQLMKFFAEVGEFDHLQLPGSEFKTGCIDSFPIEEAKESFDSKFWGNYNAVKYAMPHLRNANESSITLYSGGYSQRPAPGAVVAAAINGAVEGMGRALACELTPIRVNTIAPGLTMTDRFTEKFDSKQLENICEKFCKQLVIKRPAQPVEIAKAAIYLMNNTYATGNTLFVDGGLTLR